MYDSAAGLRIAEGLTLSGFTACTNMQPAQYAVSFIVSVFIAFWDDDDEGDA